MKNTIKPIKPNRIKQIMRLLLHKPFVLLVIMYEYRVNIFDANKAYKLWSEVKNNKND
jgi:hypothetical protein